MYSEAWPLDIFNAEWKVSSLFLSNSAESLIGSMEQNCLIIHANNFLTYNFAV